MSMTIDSTNEIMKIRKNESEKVYKKKIEGKNEKAEELFQKYSKSKLSQVLAKESDSSSNSDTSTIASSIVSFYSGDYINRDINGYLSIDEIESVNLFNI